MKKNKLSRKTKVLLSFGTSLLATTSVIAPLVCTSCSTNQNDPLKEFDKQFNLDDYKNQTFAVKCEKAYKTHLEHQGESADVIKTKVEALHDDLSDIIKKSKHASNSATVASNVMIDRMFDEYGIKMSRDFDASINFDLEINNFRQSCVGAIVRMMQEKKIPSSKIETKVNDFNTKFGALRSQLSDKYNDGLSILYNIKADAAALLDGISDEIDQIAATSTFKKFSERYQFVVNDELVKKNNTYWDNIHDKCHDGDNVSELVSKIIVVYDKNEQDPKKAYRPIDPKELENGGLIANHRVEAIWRGATGDMYNNKYTFSIEWRAISIKNYNRYKATGDKNIYLNTVATISFVKNENDVSSLQSMRDVLNLPSDKKTYSNYALPITADYEKTQLKKAYSEIHLGWDDGQGGIGSMANCAYEGYFGFEDKAVHSLSDNQIGAIGLTIGSSQTNSVTRLDALKQQVQSKVSAGADFDSLSLEEKFADSVDLVTFAEVENDDKHIVNNKFYAAYKNSPYADKSNTQNTYTYFEDWDSHFEGMPISQHLYDTTWISFKNSNQEAQDDTLQKAKELKEACSDVARINLIWGCVTGGAIAICAAYIIFAPQLPSMVGAKTKHLVAAGIGLGFTAGLAGSIIYTQKLTKRASKYYDDVKEWHDDQDYKTYINDHVKQDYNNYLCSYDVFKSSPMSKIKPIVSYYNTLQLHQEFRDCVESQKKYHVDFNEYNKISRDVNISHVVISAGLAASNISFCFALNAALEYGAEYMQEKAYWQSCREEFVLLLKERGVNTTGIKLWY